MDALETQFAPAEKSTPEVVERQTRLFQHATLLQAVSEAIPNVLLILNQQRQAVYANQQFLKALGLSCWEDAQGKRVGDLLNCTHASETAGGCGTTEFCQACGAVEAILGAQEGLQSVRECRIRTQDNQALDLLVWATPYEVDNERFTIFAAADVTDEKRRQMLERVFFHDVLNSAGGVFGLSSLLVEEDDLEETAEIAGMIQRSSERLIEEIRAQRQLSAAERGTLKLSLLEVSAAALLHEVAEAYAAHGVAEGRHIHVTPVSEDSTLVTDPVLARRVLGNMTKNALEATLPGGTVTLACTVEPSSVVMAVHNLLPMSREVQLQVFQRSFSTKGTGRGIGTYSIKLFAENYLQGSVWFTSNEEKGTTFFVRLPKDLPAGQ